VSIRCILYIYYIANEGRYEPLVSGGKDPCVCVCVCMYVCMGMRVLQYSPVVIRYSRKHPMPVSPIDDIQLRQISHAEKDP
jgi:hypothetical protein